MAAFMRHAQGTKYLFQQGGSAELWNHLRSLHSCQHLKSHPVTATSCLSGSRHPPHGMLPHNSGCSQLLHHRYVICSVFPTRLNSSNTGFEPPSLPDGYIPEPPPIPVPDPEVMETAQQVLNALGEPTLASLGLAKWTPSGLFQTALEHIHVGLDMPWWGAIVASTIVIRLAIFPLVILAQRNTASMHNHMPTIQKLQEKFTEARMSGNPLEAARLAEELTSYMKRNKVKPGRSMLVPLAQLPIFISVFVGLRQMATMPVESMSTGGLLWIPDLTIPDPFYALPFLTMATFLVTIELGVDGVSAGSQGHIIKWVMRAMPVFFLPLIINFPAAMCVYWFTSNAFSLMQVSFLKIPGVREYFQIPQLVKHDNSGVKKKKGFTKGFRETWQNSKLLAQVEDRQRMDASKFREAGTGPLQKTYPYDPTKVQAKQAAKSKSS